MQLRPVSSILKSKNAAVIDSDASITEVAREMKNHQQGAVIVVSNGRISGFITKEDIINNVVAEHLDPDNTTAGSIMNTNPIIIRSDRSFGQALYLMHEYNIHHIPVIDEDQKPLGVVCAGDALSTDLNEFAHDAEMLDHIAEIL
jgi:CBS domain-containing protein